MTVALRLSVRPGAPRVCRLRFAPTELPPPNTIKIGILQNGAIARRFAVARRERAFTLRSVQRLLETIADEHGVADWSQDLQVR